MTEYRTGDGRLDLRELAELAIDLPTRTRKLYERGKRRNPKPDSGLLEPAEIQLLVALWLENGQPVRELAERLALYPQSASKALRRLQAQGLVTESVDKKDARRRPQGITAKGRRRVEKFLSTIKHQIE